MPKYRRARCWPVNIIAYFSVPETDGVDTVAGASRVVVDGEVFGNNQYIAQLIQQETGGDLFRIETVQECFFSGSFTTF